MGTRRSPRATAAKSVSNCATLLVVLCLGTPVRSEVEDTVHSGSHLQEVDGDGGTSRLQRVGWLRGSAAAGATFRGVNSAREGGTMRGMAEDEVGTPEDGLNRPLKVSRRVDVP